ncbi:MAG TPA: hypothetical protein VFB54_12285 [Burkholderiales bacterium]|nr:hypothetical protein [Burkholderiales bacterium]
MSFYPFSILSLIVLVPIYLVGAAFLTWYGRRVKARRPDAWKVMLPLSLLVYIAPIGEELWIAGNFAYLCSKDAGIFVYKTVEVEGFYDATRPTHSGPPSPQTRDELEAGGYRFYEMPFPDRTGRPARIVHLEKKEGEWVSAVLDYPTATYQYRRVHLNTPVAQKIGKLERLVIHVDGEEVLGRSIDYSRRPPWFLIGLDGPLMFCQETRRDAEEKGNVFGPNMVLRPKR